MLASRDRRDPTFEAYLANYDQIAADDLHESIQEAAYLEAQTDRMAAIVGPVGGLDVCDLGVGQGGLLRRMLRGGAASVTGIDIATAYLRRLSDDGARVLVANAENVPFRDEFDVLIASDILEHVLNPGDMLISVHAALRRNGRFIIRVPYREDLRSYGQLRNVPYRFVHLRAFTRDVLRLMLEQGGFKVDRLVLDGFLRYRVRPGIQRNALARLAVNRFLDKRYASNADLYRMNDVLGRVLFQPYTLTAIARKDGSS
jgi:2-polyprenyl-3-methyl-5-hydroxy-6-metoxy-1,4-benzoquinol methylase